MAQVTVRVKLNKTFEVDCKGVSEESALDDIIDNNRLDAKFVEACIEVMEVTEGEYDYPEEDYDVEFEEGEI